MPAKQILQPSHYPLRESATSYVHSAVWRDTEDKAKDSAVLWVTSCPEDSLSLYSSPNYRRDLQIPCEAGIQVHHLWLMVLPL